jgi:hypothetical protein
VVDRKNGQGSKITITTKEDNIVYKVVGKRENLINIFATLLSDETDDRDSFVNLVEEAMMIVKLEKQLKKNQDKMIKRYEDKKVKIVN